MAVSEASPFGVGFWGQVEGFQGSGQQPRYDRAVGSVAYVSRVRVERVRGPLRRAYLPAEEQPVVFGVHSAVAEHYGVPAGSEAERATTLDYIVAAAAG
ncbi:hypothetical protein Gocc_0694 [Gaiella occulta]|uniref:Uncharacterized protein n=1 Tax=Gaiella occulta TaxID=1002870 RepID=A0A7M2Z2F6_9ACTN|nr:hypothetical protein Gocc_0694 [Gaiella occulta]